MLGAGERGRPGHVALYFANSGEDTKSPRWFDRDDHMSRRDHRPSPTGGSMHRQRRLRRAGRAAVALAAAVTGTLVMSPAPAHAAGPVVVSLTFDDGLTSQFQLAPTLAAHNVRGTFYLNSGRVPANPAGRMTWANATALAAAGHEIGGHTLDHVNIVSNSLTHAEKVRQVCEDRRMLWNHGFAAASFAYAEGGADEKAMAIARECGYLSARLAGKLVPTGTSPAYVVDTVPPVEGPYGIRILGTSENGPVTLEFLQSSVQAAYDKGGGWLPMLFHRVCYPTAADYAACMASYRPVDATVIDQFLTWATTTTTTTPGSITFATISEVLHGTANPPTSAPPPPPRPATAPAPTITSLSRAAVPRGRVSSVLVRGKGFTKAARVTVSGRGVRVRSLKVESPKSIKVVLAVATRAPRTARTVTVVDQKTGRRDSLPRSLRVR